MHENELFILCLGTLVMIFIGVYRAQFARLPAVSWLLTAFSALWIAWVATVLEHVALPVFFNLVEHVGYAANAVLLFIWCCAVMRNGKADVYD